MAESLVEKARRRRREQGLNWSEEDERQWLADHPDDEPVMEVTTRPEDADHPDDVIPEVEEYEPTEEDEEIDRVLANVGIVEAYRRWCGKMSPKVGSKRESVMVRCPNPAHPDKNPSAWLNLDKQVWVCAACGFQGGDKYDIAAWHFGFSVPEYKGRDFPKLRRKMAEDLGYVIKRTPSGREYLEEPEESDDETPDGPVAGSVTPVGGDGSLQREESSGTNPDREPDVEGSSSKIVSIVPEAGDEDDEPEYASIEWRTLLDDGGWLVQWMDLCSRDDLPEEYYFWLGMQALGLAVGHDAYLVDRQPVKANLFVCLLGKTGIGKSRSTRALMQLLADALPYDHDDEANQGAQLVPSAGSAEALVDSFSKPVPDPSDPSEIAYYAAVRGLIRFEELATLIGRAERAGNPMKQILMDLYDSYAPIEHKTRGHGYVRAEDHFACALTTTQPRAIRELLTQTDVDAGFVNRWIFAPGEPKDPVAYGGSFLDVSRLADPLARYRSWASRGKPMALDGMSLARWEDFFNDTLYPQKMDDESGLLSRIDLTMKKLVLLFAIDSKEAMPSLASVERAIELHEYLTISYQMLGREIGHGAIDDCMDYVRSKIRGWEARLGLLPSAKDLLNERPRHIDAPTLRETLRLMTELGAINEKVTKVKGGEKVVRYAVVD